jgi:hypothetical protein
MQAGDADANAAAASGPSTLRHVRRVEASNREPETSRVRFEASRAV